MSPKAQPADAAIRLASAMAWERRKWSWETQRNVLDVSHCQNRGKMLGKSWENGGILPLQIAKLCGESPGILIGNCQKRVCLKTLGDAVKGDEDPMVEKKCVGIWYHIPILRLSQSGEIVGSSQRPHEMNGGDYWWGINVEIVRFQAPMRSTHMWHDPMMWVCLKSGFNRSSYGNFERDNLMINQGILGVPYLQTKPCDATLICPKWWGPKIASPCVQISAPHPRTGTETGSTWDQRMVHKPAGGLKYGHKHDNGMIIPNGWRQNTSQSPNTIMRCWGKPNSVPF